MWERRRRRGKGEGKEASRGLEDRRMGTHALRIVRACVCVCVCVCVFFLQRAALLFVCSFEGVVVARLPFQPYSLVSGITHRGLPGEDYTECSFVFLYLTCTMAIRQVRGRERESERERE